MKVLRVPVVLSTYLSAIQSVNITILALGDGRMEKGSQLVSQEGQSYLDWLASTLSDPSLCVLPVLVQGKKTSLATTLDELIGFCHEFGGENPLRDGGIWRDGTSGRVPRDLGNLWGRIDEVGLDGSGLGDRRGALEPVSQEQLSVVFADGWRGGKGEWARMDTAGSARRVANAADSEQHTFGGHGLVERGKGGGDSRGRVSGLKGSYICKKSGTSEADRPRVSSRWGYPIF